MLKGLESLKRIEYNYVQVFKARENNNELLTRDINIIKKELKALEIIKDKKVFVANLLYHFETDDNVIEYNRKCGWAKSELTQEEYDLLKEILCYE